MTKSKRLKMLSVRASEEEIGRVKELAAELMKTHCYLKEADVIRELIGFEDTGLITPEMRKRLRAPSDQILQEIEEGNAIEIEKVADIAEPAGNNN